MIGKLNSKQIEVFLGTQMIGRLGCHHDGLTYVVPISFAYSAGYIYCITYEGMKLDIMRKNPKICFQVDDLVDMANWNSVICWGEFEELTQSEARKEGLLLLKKRLLPLISSVVTHFSPTWPFIDKDVDKFKGIVFRVRLKEKTGRFESK